jgi:hypothetical protein
MLWTTIHVYLEQIYMALTAPYLGQLRSPRSSAKHKEGGGCDTLPIKRQLHKGAGTKWRYSVNVNPSGSPPSAHTRYTTYKVTKNLKRMYVLITIYNTYKDGRCVHMYLYIYIYIYIYCVAAQQVSGA